jgi:signal transduction histidine kinase
MTPDTLDLLREVSHRLRSPLATVYGYASLLEANATAASVEPAELANWAHHIQTEIERLDALLVDLSRLRLAASGSPQLALCDLRQVVCAAAQSVRHDFDQHVAIEDGLPVPFVGDAILLTRAIYHLLAHAHRVRLTDDPIAIRLSIELDAPWRQPAATDAWWLLCSTVIANHQGHVAPTSSGLGLEFPRVSST